MLKIDKSKFHEKFTKLLESKEPHSEIPMFKIYSIFFLNDYVSGIDFDSFSIEDAEAALEAIQYYSVDEDLDYCEEPDPNAENPLHLYHQHDNMIWGDLPNLPRKKVVEIDYI